MSSASPRRLHAGKIPLPRLREAGTGLIQQRPLLVVVLAPRPEAIAAREAARGKNAYSHWTIDLLDNGLRNETPRLGLWLDTSEQTPDDTINEILTRAWTEAIVR